MSDETPSKDLDTLTDEDRLEFIANIPSDGMQKLVAYFLTEAEAYDDDFLRSMVDNYLRTTTSRQGRQSELLVEGMKASRETPFDEDAFIAGTQVASRDVEEDEDGESKGEGLAGVRGFDGS